MNLPCGVIQGPPAGSGGAAGGPKGAGATRAAPTACTADTPGAAGAAGGTSGSVWPWHPATTVPAATAPHTMCAAIRTRPNAPDMSSLLFALVILAVFQQTWPRRPGAD